MGKYLLLAFCGLFMATTAQAQQATGGVTQNKHQAAESLNTIRMQLLASSVKDSLNALRTVVTANTSATAVMDDKYSTIIDGPTGNDGLINRLNELDALIRKVGACKAKTVSGCAIPLTPLEGTSTSGCAPGYISKFAGTWNYTPPCAAKCDVDKGLVIVTNNCRAPKSCAAASSVYMPGYGGLAGPTYTASIPASGHDASRTMACSSAGSCMGSGTWQNNYSSCTFKCNDGSWVLASKSGETKVKSCPPMRFGPVIDMGFGF